jgi:predicted tellurium resistance membrane protein TerC
MDPSNRSKNDVQTTRSWTGLLVVAVGDVAIALAAILTIFWITSRAGSATGDQLNPVVAILTSAFTAIGTLTTAYFGIRASSNTAQESINQNDPTAGQGQLPANPPITNERPAG